MPQEKRGTYTRQAINVIFIVAMPFGVFLFARFDFVSSEFFFIFPLAFLFSIMTIFRTFVLVYRRGISWTEVLYPVLLFAAALAYVVSGHPYTAGRNALFGAFEPRFDQFVYAIHLDSAKSLRSIPVPRTLSASGISVAHEKQYNDGSVLVLVMTSWGGYTYSSEQSADLVEDLDRLAPHRWSVAKKWEAFKR